jgi:hypothetical protein
MRFSALGMPWVAQTYGFEVFGLAMGKRPPLKNIYSDRRREAQASIRREQADGTFDFGCSTLLPNYRSCSGYEIIVGLPKASKECGTGHFWAGANQGGEGRLARRAASIKAEDRFKTLRMQKAVWSGAT